MNKNVFCTNNANKLLGHRLIYRKYCKSGFWMISTKMYGVKKKTTNEGDKHTYIFSEWTKKKKTGFHVKHSILHSQQISRLIFKMRFRRYQTPHECIKKQNCKIVIIFQCFNINPTTLSSIHSLWATLFSKKWCMHLRSKFFFLRTIQSSCVRWMFIMILMESFSS